MNTKINRIAEKIAVQSSNFVMSGALTAGEVAAISYELAIEMAEQSKNYMPESSTSKRESCIPEVKNSIPIGQSNAVEFEDINTDVSYSTFMRYGKLIDGFRVITGKRGIKSRFYLDR